MTAARATTRNHHANLAAVGLRLAQCGGAESPRGSEEAQPMEITNYRHVFVRIEDDGRSLVIDPVSSASRMPFWAPMRYSLLTSTLTAHERD
jgi:hypothetical protein